MKSPIYCRVPFRELSYGVTLPQSPITNGGACGGGSERPSRPDEEESERERERERDRLRERLRERERE